MHISLVLAAEPNVVVETEALVSPQKMTFTPASGTWLTRAVQCWRQNPTLRSKTPGISLGGAVRWSLRLVDDGFDLDHPDLQGVGKLGGPH